MINRIPNPIFLFLSLLIGVGLYWSSMNGQPIWDDFSYMFKYSVITQDFSYLTIWREFNWPLSVTVQKLLFSLWKYEYVYYHVLNFLLHFLNAFILLKLVEKMKLPFARILFLLFLFHPANVIAVSWMIQLKTLMCFFFGIISFFFLTKVTEDKRWYLPACFFFLLSLLSKTSSLALPVLFLIFLYKKVPRKQLLWMIPFFLLSLGASLRILHSPVRKEAVGKVESRHLDPIDAEASSQAYDPEGKLVIVRPGVKTETAPKEFINYFTKIIPSVHYYFWQTLLPMENQPVKGLNYTKPGIVEYFHIVFLILLITIFWGSATAVYLGAGYVMMLPFLGFVDAPYMNLAWVSDQHLYFALPLFLSFWLSVISYWKNKYAPLIPLLFLPIYFYKVAVTTPLYKNEIVFYNSCLEADALNVPIAYNLAISYLNQGKINEAINVTSTMVHMPQVVPEILNNRYFPYIYILHMDLKDIINKKSK
jgi:hypothetical protein